MEEENKQVIQINYTMKTHALDQRAQLLGLAANSMHSSITKSDVCPEIIREQDWQSALRKALNEGYLQRSDEGSGSYVQGNLPAKLGFQHDLWIVLFDAPWDLERKATLLYACTAVKMLEKTGMWPAQQLREAIGCPRDLWNGVSELLRSEETSCVDGPYAPEEVFCHVNGGYDLYVEMLVEIAPRREDSVPEDYQYVFRDGDLS